MSNLDLSEEAVRVLRTLRKESMDGYTLQSAAQVDPSMLTTAVKTLLVRGWVTVVGNINETEIGRAFLRVPIQARAHVEEFLRNPQIVAKQ